MQRAGNNKGSDIRLTGCGMRHKIEAGCGIRETLRARYGMKISWRDQDALISMGVGGGGGVRDSFEIDSGMRDFNGK